jgi:phosphinothricin acetyltransferase
VNLQALGQEIGGRLVIGAFDRGEQFARGACDGLLAGDNMAPPRSIFNGVGDGKKPTCGVPDKGVKSRTRYRRCSRMTHAQIRPAAEADFAAIQAIYAHHVANGTASFEEVPPARDEMMRRWAAVRAGGLPYVVAELSGVVVGYAYAHPYHARSAYRFTLEDSIYVAPDRAGHGIGGALLDRVLAETEAAGYRQMIAIIGDSANAASIGLHRSRGFADGGVLRAVGYKFGRWLDSVFMQRPLGPGAANAPVRP